MLQKVFTTHRGKTLGVLITYFFVNCPKQKGEIPYEDKKN